MKRIVDFAYMFLKDYIKETDTVVDFTMGNGHDTLKLATLANKGKVYAFDIQQTALENTQKRLNDANIKNVNLILDSHHQVKKYLSHFKAGMFNFGYLPQGDPNITTLLETSVEAVKIALELLDTKGMLILVLYPGHEEGHKESQYFEEFTQNLDRYYYEVFKFSLTNKNNCPYIIGIEKKKNL